MNLEAKIAALLHDHSCFCLASGEGRCIGPFPSERAAARALVAGLGLTVETKYGVRAANGFTVPFGPQPPDLDDIRRFGGADGEAVQREALSSVGPWHPVEEKT